MTQIEQDEQEDKPLDPAMEKVRRKMIRLQIVSGSVMFISLMAVFGAVVYKAMGPSKAVQTQTEAPNLAVPTGNGPLAVTAIEVADRLADHGIGVTVVDPRWVKPVDEAVVAEARGHRLVAVAEDVHRRPVRLPGPPAPIAQDPEAGQPAHEEAADRVEDVGRERADERQRRPGRREDALFFSP